MPGFGSGAFGSGPFGQANWSADVLWGLIPGVYKDQDLSQGGIFRAFIAGLQPTFDKLLGLEADFATLRDAFTVRTQNSDRARFKFGALVVPYVNPEQQGSDGKIVGGSEFDSVSARFQYGDLGKNLTIRGSGVTGNNRTVVITAVLTQNAVLTDPPLALDAGPLQWELRPVTPSSSVFTLDLRGGDVGKLLLGWTINDGYTSFQVVGRRQFLTTGAGAGRTEQEGTDGVLVSEGVFRSASIVISGADVGKPLSLAGSSKGNNGLFEIARVDMSLNPPLVHLDGEVSPEGGLTWALYPYSQVDLVGQAFPCGRIEQEGHDLSFTAGPVTVGVLNVSAASATFQSVDVVDAQGHPVTSMLTVANCLNGDDGEYQILEVMSPTQARVDHAFSVNESGKYWAKRVATGAGDIEKLGTDLYVIGAGEDPVSTVVQALSASFDPTDVGRILTVRVSSVTANVGDWLVLRVVSATRLEVSGVLTPDTGPDSWEIHSGSKTMCTASPSSLLQWLAPDFGIRIDQQETEARQRAWVGNVTRWIDLKGTDNSYELLGRMSGFDTVVEQWWRIGLDFFTHIPAAYVYFLGDTGPGKYGSTGALVAGAVGAHFLDSSAQFLAGDVGTQVRVISAANSANQRMFTVDEVLSSTEVLLRSIDGGVVPDYGVGGAFYAPKIGWSLVRLYTSLPPSQPCFDEFDADGLETLVGGPTHLSLDKYCWESDFLATVSTVVTAVTLVSGTTWCVGVGVEAEVITDASSFKLVDPATGSSWRIETMDGPPSYAVYVIAKTAPVSVGHTVLLQYLCKQVESCQYCGASVLGVQLTPNAVLLDGAVALENATERVLGRFVEVTPEHVRLVPRIQNVLACTWPMPSVEFSGGEEISGVIWCPFAPFFDYDAWPGDDPSDLTDSTIMVVFDAVLV